MCQFHYERIRFVRTMGMMTFSMTLSMCPIAKFDVKKIHDVDYRSFFLFFSFLP